MKIKATLSEICNLILWLKEIDQNPVLENIQTLIYQNIQFDNLVTIKKNLLLGKVQIKATVKAIDGCIEIDIASATVFEMSFFGLVRVKAAQILMQVLKPYEPKIYIWKHTNGNLRMQSPRINFTLAQILNDTMILDFIAI